MNAYRDMSIDELLVELDGWGNDLECEAALRIRELLKIVEGLEFLCWFCHALVEDSYVDHLWERARKLVESEK